ncbi:54S ribosomal protein L17 mitochondrial [Desmophyllum pertusum]|uniref:Large ribosomal subunit protein bL17m n=1 Tax=Desmophyllum pertusum TaxID=174260 RepID=A0A9W9ZCT4_9CNID|nr:54S ribosomal protein L17 mitochondrial [Desmophyllum pertusum]
MATMLWKVAGEGTFLKSVLPCVNLIPVRYKTHRRRPTKKKISPFVQRRTDLIKKLVLALVQHERIQTTDRKAQQLKKYGDLLVSLAQRRRPPPDLDLIEDGFVLTEGESEERRITKRIINRKSKRVVQPLPVLSEEEFVIRCREEAYNMLLGNEEALEKLYSTLKERYKERYGNFVRITRIPNPTTSPYPNMAYAEFVGNSLPPLPKLPVVKEGRWIIYGRDDDDDDELVEKSVAVQSKSLLR